MNWTRRQYYRPYVLGSEERAKILAEQRIKLIEEQKRQELIKHADEIATLLAQT